MSLEPERQGLSANVRGLIERGHQAREDRAAATAYQRFLDENPDERSAMETWESAPDAFICESLPNASR